MPQTVSSINDQLTKLIGCQDLGDITPELCDFSLEEQNAVSEAQGVQPSAASDFVPVLGKSVTYIVTVVMINDQDEVLMIQEAKQSCAGKWYLPAGKMETGETIIEAAVREVFEETGLKCEMTTLIGVETAGGSWVRFLLTGRVLSGNLKTPDQADQESLQAKWFADISELTLRANDILNLIKMTRTYKARAQSPALWHSEMMPIQYAHHKNYLRIVAVIRKRSTNTLNVLVSERNVHHLPTVEMHPARSLHSTLRKFMIELFGAELPQHRPHGLLTVEHSPAAYPHTTDGFCLTLLVVFRPPLEDVAVIGKAVWQEMSKELEDKFGRMVGSNHSTLPLNVIR
ncbi:8-oxo-dGDP phosphatase NUDT18 [Eupeodes corollae]|uniref:8-oxo-dGDP phosphatase NUDT18 n=1 Tax=Eupeodes corollae TaxID=290404 RepID=UPI0024908B32|nr:8-oxo-dGDP phosphatase NUDT18 [Eupeodes corollae]XP_055903438.1 8-oxo-dGDP phosphatase NUDT18 [Eupeodes corollae]XP_055903439.1 8-oxo-dGDP phosphatase NUDT18 [Eupeodes corollae]